MVFLPLYRMTGSRVGEQGKCVFAIQKPSRDSTFFGE